MSVCAIIYFTEYILFMLSMAEGCSPPLAFFLASDASYFARCSSFMLSNCLARLAAIASSFAFAFSIASAFF